MKARCYRCQGTFDTDRFGTQRCTHCGAEVYLPDPAAPPPATTGAPVDPTATETGTGTGTGTSPETPPPTSNQPPPPGWGAPPPPGWPPPPPGSWPPPPAGSWPPPPPGWAPIPPGALAPDTSLPAPFAERARLGFFPAFAETLRLVAFEFVRFFRQVRTDQTRAAVLFGVICATVGNWGSLLFSWWIARAGLRFVTQVTRSVNDPRVDTKKILEMMQSVTGGSVLAQALLSPLAALLFVYATAGIFHLLLLLVRGAPRGFDATLTVVGYASGLLLLRAVPMCGALFAGVWFLVAAVQGLAEAQRAGTGKAAFAVLAPLLLACICACVAGGIAGVAGFGALGGAPPAPPEGTGL
jgi:hypothetical protein